MQIRATRALEARPRLSLPLSLTIRMKTAVDTTRTETENI
jgi:hypothetical protein